MAILHAGAIVEDGAILGEGVVVGYNAVILSGTVLNKVTRIENGSVIGANATILPGVTIGAGAIIGAGSLVEKNIPSNAVVTGNPSVITGYTHTILHAAPNFFQEPTHPIALETKLDVGKCCFYKLPLIPDIRGSLSVAEYSENIPFVIKRCFWVFDVPSKEVRGEHAHKTLHQFLICVKGMVNVVLDDGRKRTEVILDRPNKGLYISPLVWGIQYKYSEDAVLLVLASDKYDSDDYLRNYEEFLDYVKGAQR